MLSLDCLILRFPNTSRLAAEFYSLLFGFHHQNLFIFLICFSYAFWFDMFFPFKKGAIDQ